MSAAVELVAVHTWPEAPLDFVRQAAAPPFTADDVPAELAGFACEWARAAGFDASGVIVASVGAAASAISDGLRLSVNPSSDYYESARLWILLLAPPGAAKTPSIGAATGPIKAMHRELVEGWKKRCAELQKAANATDEKAESPARPALFTSDATTESLSELLAGNPRGLLFLNEEFESWLGSHDAYRGGGSKDRGEWLRAFDGGPHQVDRIKRGSFFVPNWGVSVLSATTPSVLSKLSQKLPADGLLQRFIPVFVSPGTVADPRADVSLHSQSYHNTLQRLFTYGPDEGVRVVRMTDEAAELMRAERERLRALAVAVGVYGDGFAGHVAKHAAMLARVALTFHAVTGRGHPCDRLLDVRSVRLASRFMAKVFRHSQAVYGDLVGREGALPLARSVATSLLADKRLEITRRELTQGCYAWRRADDRQRDEAMQFMVDMSWLAVVDGDYLKPHATRWAVNPAVHQLFGKYGTQHSERRRLVKEALRGPLDG